MFSLENKHFANRELYLQAQRDLIQKGLYGGLPCEDLIMKGGEGSRGGKVIGHTKSGKPVYDSEHHELSHTIKKVLNKLKSGQSLTLASKATEILNKNKIHKDQLKVFKQVGLVSENHFPPLALKEEGSKVEKAMTAAGGEGVTQKESVEHNPQDMQNPKPSDLKKAYEILGLGDLIEKAEGSRGGKVIGHTKSGKPVYASMKASHYDNFTAEDHRDAMTHHDNKMRKTPSHKKEHEEHQLRAADHERLADRLEDK